MTLDEYFALPDTPAKHSPVGEMMPKILSKNPGMTFDDARAEAKRLLTQAAGRYRYLLPAILSPAQKLQRQETLWLKFGKKKKSKTAAMSL